jgi:membrane-associated phospholipid phosphatase
LPAIPNLLLPRLRPAAGARLLAACVLVFCGLAADLRWNGPVTGADPAVSDWFQRNAQPLFTALLSAVSHLHGTWPLLLAALAAALVLAWYGNRSWLPLLVLSVPGGMILNWLVKHAFQRARPTFDSPMLAIGSYSFPSGHTAGATVWWGFALLLWFAWERRPGRRAAACALAATMVVLTALSRVYLGAHYLSDVLAAIAEGLAWLVLCVLACQSFGRVMLEPGPRSTR